jgi:hypothetical protein
MKKLLATVIIFICGGDRDDRRASGRAEKRSDLRHPRRLLSGRGGVRTTRDRAPGGETLTVAPQGYDRLFWLLGLSSRIHLYFPPSCDKAAAVTFTWPTGPFSPVAPAKKRGRCRLHKGQIRLDDPLVQDRGLRRHELDREDSGFGGAGCPVTALQPGAAPNK